jgi:hypothetical protein
MVPARVKAWTGSYAVLFKSRRAHQIQTGFLLKLSLTIHFRFLPGPPEGLGPGLYFKVFLIQIDDLTIRAWTFMLNLMCLFVLSIV